MQKTALCLLVFAFVLVRCNIQPVSQCQISIPNGPGTMAFDVCNDEAFPTSFIVSFSFVPAQPHTFMPPSPIITPALNIAQCFPIMLNLGSDGSKNIITNPTVIVTATVNQLPFTTTAIYDEMCTEMLVTTSPTPSPTSSPTTPSPTPSPTPPTPPTPKVPPTPAPTIPPTNAPTLSPAPTPVQDPTTKERRLTALAWIMFAFLLIVGMIAIILSVMLGYQNSGTVNESTEKLTTETIRENGRDVYTNSELDDIDLELSRETYNNVTKKHK